MTKAEFSFYTKLPMLQVPHAELCPRRPSRDSCRPALAPPDPPAPAGGTTTAASDPHSPLHSPSGGQQRPSHTPPYTHSPSGGEPVSLTHSPSGGNQCPSHTPTHTQPSEGVFGGGGEKGGGTGRRRHDTQRRSPRPPPFKPSGGGGGGEGPAPLTPASRSSLTGTAGGILNTSCTAFFAFYSIFLSLILESPGSYFIYIWV